MRKTPLGMGLMLLMGLMVAIIGMPTATAAEAMPTLVVDGQPVLPTASLEREKGITLITAEDLATYLGATLQWNDAHTVWMQKYGNTILLRLTTGQALKNGQPVTLPAAARLIDGKLYVPLRFMAENLKAAVLWDGPAKQIQILTGERHLPPERVGQQTFNAIIAYLDQDNLWLLDGRKPGALPHQITDTGHAEIVGWSPDGQWLAYKHVIEAGGPAYLWVVGADGQEPRQLDTLPVEGEPSWSGKANRLAWVGYERGGDERISVATVKYARVEAGETPVTTLRQENLTIFPSLAWHPDEEHLAVSLPRSPAQPPTIERLSLTGEREIIYVLPDPEPIDPEGLYDWAFIALKYSPDGRYLAHHLRQNSGSLTADVVATGVLDLVTKQVTGLGEGLSYREWLAFSPDGRFLAHIAGAGRDVNLNKRLEIANLAGEPPIIDRGQAGMVDSQPAWLPNENPVLLIGRGPEAAGTATNLPAPLVPGQRIYRLDYQGNAVAVTMDSENTADYYPSPSPTGREMFFLRLERFNQGSLYLQPVTAPEKAVEILRGLRISPGYYGNYYPLQVSIYWF